ncbi:tryptophan-rich sensory protein [Listeria weihenstephanensis]|uniref:Tryptophan-rich sensory protein n=1 Tax=Listeria weihenstephanensis TaxID=1006155 RepID=A0A841ZA41_9LIST|nr:tryptophan-rich sensory protein [Listeria weihenstephanensis]MBC1501163.1 tryptophan-rich sensory protein [Listeria weihenstephanensis]
MRLLWMYLCFIVMIGVNALANILPLNAVTTGEISNRLDVLFTPAGYVFIIWGVIYVSLFIWLIALTFHREKVTGALAFFFCITSLLNGLWIICWHYGYFLTSVGVMLLLLIGLIALYKAQQIITPSLLWRAPLSLYLSWISVATIANICYYTTWKEFTSFLGLKEVAWSIILLIVATLIAYLFRIRENDWIAPLVFVWAFVGIYIRVGDMSALVAYTALILAVLLFMANFIPTRQKRSRVQ